jgi:hypothetical protein
MLLSEARTRALKMVDDAPADKYDTTEVADALRVAQGEVWGLVLSSGSNVFNTQASFSSSGVGVLDLSSVAPRRLVSVSQYLSGSRLTVRPARLDEGPSNLALATTLSVVYVPDVTFPAGEGNAFVWGGTTIAESIRVLLDSLLVGIAALELKPKEGEVNKGLQQRVDEKRAAVLELVSVPGWSVMPLDSMAGGRVSRASFRYVVTGPHTLQLVQV